MNETLTGTWNYPTRIWAGPGRLADLPAACTEAGIARPLVVTDTGLRDSPMVQQVLHLLPAARLFSDVQGNPVPANIDAGLAVYRSGGHDGVVAIGGGSAIDAGKAIAFMSGQTRSLWDFEDIGDYWRRALDSGIAPSIAIPTTAGTGSEVGRASVILDPTLHQKKIIFHPQMMPKIVIADPQLTVGLPPKLTAATGLDAFVHCFEAYCAPGFHPFADGLALEGMRLVQNYLPRAFNHGSDLLARSRMLAAASMGAAAFQKGLGGVHAIAHPVGSLYNTHHGLTNAVLLPYVMIHNREAITEQMNVLGRVLGLKRPGFEGVLEWVLAFRTQLGIPHTLAEIGVTQEHAATIGRDAVQDPSAAGNPVPSDAAAFERIFRCAVVGNLTLRQ